MTLANVLTLARLACAPLLGILIFTHDDRALWIFGFAALTDLLDGLAARTISRKSQLGSLLDPLADKALLLISFIAGACVGLFPLWLVATTVLRDAAQLTVAFALVRRGALDTQRFEPTRLGKYAAFAQALTIVGALLLDRNVHSSLLRSYLPAWMIVCALFTLTAGLQYLVLLRSRIAESRQPESVTHA